MNNVTSNEIKSKYSMEEVIRQYGFSPNRARFIKCPFHNDTKSASLKIYKDSFYCFGCGANGDIFTFIQMIDNCDFKTAYLSLGGSYEQLSRNAQLVARDKREREKQKRERIAMEEAETKKRLADTLTLLQTKIQDSIPLSDEWCLAQNCYPVAAEMWQEKYVDGKEVSNKDVFRLCGRVGRDFDSIRGSVG